MASEDEVQLLTFWASPFALRAELALCAKGIPYTKLPQDLFNKSPLLLQSNPTYQKVPVLLHRGKAICESIIIVQYIDEAFPSSDEGKDLLPKDPYERAMARFWADFAANKVFGTISRISHTEGEARQAAVKEAKEYLSILEAGFAKDGPFFGGAKVGFVDIILGPLAAVYEPFRTASGVSLEFEKLPRLCGWIKAMEESELGQCFPPPEKLVEIGRKMRQIYLQRAAAAQ